ncbi:MAG TPA: methyltransferase domain-containing protein [Polyangiaceae bacterium]|nr:methyltransferase domain-containing protein [Polyangiaceae bacterium]
MAATAPSGFDAERLREAIRETYEQVARDPGGVFHFHRGREYAVSRLGYDAAELDLLPRAATDRFAGVGNPLQIGAINLGEAVLDHACGAGTDLLLAARRAGPAGRALGVDITAGMRAVAERAVAEAGLSESVEIRAGSYEDLPVASASVDVVISNGVVNLAPDKPRVFAEIWRVLRPGGRLYMADVVVARELKLETREQPELWAACIAGALPESELSLLALEAGLVDAQLLTYFECFAGTSAEQKVSRDLKVRSVNFFARKAAS